MLTSLLFFTLTVESDALYVFSIFVPTGCKSDERDKRLSQLLIIKINNAFTIVCFVSGK